VFQVNQRRIVATSTSRFGPGLTRRAIIQAGAASAGLAVGARTSVRATDAEIVGDGTTVMPVEGPRQAIARQVIGDGLLPANRILTYYGFPTNPNMGILGEYGVNDDLDGLRAALEEQAAEYEIADPSRPMLIGFEVIASVAQGDAGADGMFLDYTDSELIQQYVDYTAANGMLLFLDYQFGLHPFEDELDAFEEWIAYEHVHLALDPEFRVPPGEIPGQDVFGQLTAAEITSAQHRLVARCAELGIPPKVLVVHQFYYTMIQDKEDLAPVPGVQLVIDMDGHGDPETKLGTYEVVITQEPIEYNGIKLFYPFDEPLMSAAEVLALDPAPDWICYQ
jgi:hypothetical protein